MVPATLPVLDFGRKSRPVLDRGWKGSSILPAVRFQESAPAPLTQLGASVEELKQIERSLPARKRTIRMRSIPPPIAKYEERPRVFSRPVEFFD
jgi:hypothetical protein